ncbi:MAG: STAS domain-containing protein [Gammaproteobacteria bacterium]
MNTENASTDPEVLALPEKFTISECEEFYSMLCERIKKKTSLVLDASSVKQIDTAALQLITVSLKENIALDNKIVLSGVSDEFVERASLLGVHDYLNSKSS